MGDAANAIWQSNVLILTFGTALVYRLVKTQQTVANCQKLPASEFRRELSRVDEISIAVENCIEELRKNNPTLKVMLTVSPVRHLSGGLDENNLSKSMLRIACESIQNTLREVYYFPAFEIMMDELRDYRFYKDDLIHPTSFAEQFIWEKFQRSYFSVETIKRLQEVEKIRAALAHKPFHPNSAAHKTFLLDLLQKMKMMEGSVDLVDEIYDLKVKLENWV